MVVFNVIRVNIVYVTIKVGMAKHSWTSWPRPLSLCPYETFSKVGDYGLSLIPLKSSRMNGNNVGHWVEVFFYPSSKCSGPTH